MPAPGSALAATRIAREAEAPRRGARAARRRAGRGSSGSAALAGGSRRPAELSATDPRVESARPAGGGSRRRQASAIPPGGRRPHGSAHRRGTVVIDAARCRGCELCIPACPPRVLRMSARRSASRLPAARAARGLHGLRAAPACWSAGLLLRGLQLDAPDAAKTTGGIA
ncbi:MAG: 4Fe-4S binding protein [Myxococcota bacterium]